MTQREHAQYAQEEKQKFGLFCFFLLLKSRLETGHVIFVFEN